ncbi:MAG: AMIN domain-containing protein [Nocardioides sp.]|nr:AMIN domain-containing protein [Nocardioides sp.]
MRPAASALTLIVAAALLAACGSGEDSDPMGSAATSELSRSHRTAKDASTADTPRTDTPGTGTSRTDDGANDPTPGSPALPENTRPKAGRGSGEAITLTEVRVDDHEDFGRIVLEFSGTGTPGWAVNYVDEATLEGSGAVVRLRGDSTLNIYASNTTWPAPNYYDGPERLNGENGIPDLYVAGTFEGYTQVLAGIDGRAPFRVFTLNQPSRLVVDIADDNGG